MLRNELKEEIEGVKNTLTGVEKSLESAWNVIADLQAESKSHSDFKKTYQSILDNVKSELAMVSSKNAKLETEIDALKVRFLEEQEKVIALENYSRRENLHFMNVPEQEGENCANIIYDIVENELNMDVENLQFHAIHRVGKRRSSDETSKAYPRPIIARFLCREDRDMVLKEKGSLRNSQYENVYITQDYAKAILTERKVLIKAMFLARKKGMNARVVDRNLVVNNNVYNVDNIPDNLKKSSILNSNSS